MDIMNAGGIIAAQNYGQTNANEALKMERNEINESCWQNNAAEAIHLAFSNMDEFTDNFKQQSGLFEA